MRSIFRIMRDCMTRFSSFESLVISRLDFDLTTMMFKKFPGKNDKVEKITIPALRVNSC